MNGSKYDEIASKLTQEMFRRGEEVPERYFVKDAIPQAVDAPKNVWEETLVIDFSLITKSSNDPLAKKELDKLHYALKHWGCFQIVNHGMTNLLEKALDVTKLFFALPLEEKLKSSIPGQVLGGYGNYKVEHNDQIENWFDQLFLTLYPQDQIKLDIWPEKPDTFRETMKEYGTKIAYLLEWILKAMAKSLDIKEDSFVKKLEENPKVETKFSIYPPCSKHERVLGSRPHSDPSVVTILLTDDRVDGLQIFKDDHWYKIPINPGSIFVNLGDCGEVFSNGIFKTAVHRVVTHPEKERVSIGAFFMPSRQAEIGPVDELITESQPQVYKKVDLTTLRKLIYANMGPDTKLLDSLRL